MILETCFRVKFTNFVLNKFQTTMKNTILIFFFLNFISWKGVSQDKKEFHNWALTPPMGWNSWDCFGPSVVESEVKANADFMAANLKQYGWEYIVVDIRWYVDNQTTGQYNAFSNSTFIYDEYGRYLPSPTRFPSSKNGAGFKPLADYVHGLGLKFGIHIMRGVPKVAVTNKLPIKGLPGKNASDIYSTALQCTWLQDNWTIDANKAGAQEYYNSILDLYASWGVDFIKVDDLSRPYHKAEIEMLRKAIDQTGRKILLSMSPGATPLDEHLSAKDNANMWRTVDDFWDNWSQLNYQFGVSANWAKYIAPGAWPDADMLPLGHLSIRGERGVDRYTNFTRDEQYTLMTLWTIFKSPLMFGGHLPDNNAFTDSLLTNEKVLYMHKYSVDNEQATNKEDIITWSANDPYNGEKYIAVFNNGGDGFISTKDLLYRSGTVSTLTDGYGVDIDIQIPEGSKQLFLIVNDGGDGFNCDHADWINPTAYLSNGDSIQLTNLDWEYASAGWNTVQKNKSISGGTLNVKGTTYSNGIGTHARSVVLYGIPENTVRFKAFAGLDLGGTSQTGCGSTVEFAVANQDPTLRQVNLNTAVANSGRISKTIQREGVHLEADIAGASKLYLVVTDAGDNYNFDHGDWINPAIYTENGDSILLSSLNWVSATSGWATVRKNLSLNGNPLKVNGKTYTNGFGVNSYSTIEFDLPQGYSKFKSFCGFDDEVINATSGVTIEFLVYTENPTITESLDLPINLVDYGIYSRANIENLWTGQLTANVESQFSTKVNAHGAQLYKITPLERDNSISLDIDLSSTTINESQEIDITVNVNSPNKSLIPITGWVQLIVNDSIVDNLKLDENGNARFAISPKVGNHQIKLNYGGNSRYNTKQSELIEITVFNYGTQEKSLSANKLWLSKSNEISTLSGLNAGDIVSLIDLQGKKIKQVTVNSSSIDFANHGIYLVEIKNTKGLKVQKFAL